MYTIPSYSKNIMTHCVFIRLVEVHYPQLRQCEVYSKNIMCIHQIGGGTLSPAKTMRGPSLSKQLELDEHYSTPGSEAASDNHKPWPASPSPDRWVPRQFPRCSSKTLLSSKVLVICFWFKYYLGQKYYAPHVRRDRGSNSWPPDHDSTFHFTETPPFVRNQNVPELKSKC